MRRLALALSGRRHGAGAAAETSGPAWRSRGGCVAGRATNRKPVGAAADVGSQPVHYERSRIHRPHDRLMAVRDRAGCDSRRCANERSSASISVPVQMRLPCPLARLRWQRALVDGEAAPGPRRCRGSGRLWPGIDSRCRSCLARALGRPADRSRWRGIVHAGITWRASRASALERRADLAQRSVRR